jgi:hypothetical protein
MAGVMIIAATRAAIERPCVFFILLLQIVFEDAWLFRTASRFR